MPKKVPDFAKLHAKEFGKMDSIDVYLSKKKDRSARSVAKERFEKAREITREHRDGRTTMLPWHKLLLLSQKPVFFFQFQFVWPPCSSKSLNPKQPALHEPTAGLPWTG